MTKKREFVETKGVPNIRTQLYENSKTINLARETLFWILKFVPIYTTRLYYYCSDNIYLY